MYAEIINFDAAAAGALLVEAAGIAAKVYAVTPGGLCFDVPYILTDQGDISLAAGRGLDPVAVIISTSMSPLPLVDAEKDLHVTSPFNSMQPLQQTLPVFSYRFFGYYKLQR